MGIPFMPVRGILGSDYFQVQPHFKNITCPFSGRELVAVKAINPDFTVIHAFQADTQGNLLIERHSDVDLALQAAKVSIATVEEIVEPEDMVETAGRRRLSWLNVHYIVQAPGGARPTACPGYYQPDAVELKRYLEAAHDPESFRAYLDQTWSPAAA